MKAAVYLRVSSSEQTVDNQLPQLEDFARVRGYEVAEVYQEQTSAWKNGHQVELARLLGDLKSGRRKYAAVIIWALDRLSREGVATVLNLVNTFKKYDCRVLSYQEPWTDSPGPMGDILYSVTAWVAEFESQRRSERTKAGLARALKEGKRLGRPVGSRDKKKRKRTGYLLRYVDR